jgi:excisionase family DNA binding protein
LIVDLARHVPDQSIASMLNRLGVRTARGITWTQQRVAAFRCDHQIPVYREGERAERSEVILQEAVKRLGVSKMTVIRMIKDGLLPARQICSGAPYVIREADLSRMRLCLENLVAMAEIRFARSETNCRTFLGCKLPRANSSCPPGRCSWHHIARFRNPLIHSRQHGERP